MPDEKPSGDTTPEEFLQELADRPIPVGTHAALAARARRRGLDDAIRESKTTPGYDGTPAPGKPSANDAEREQTEAIKEAKSSGSSVRPFEKSMKGVAESVEAGLSALAGIPTVPTAPTPTHASTLEKYWSEDPRIKDSPGVADRAVELVEDAERATATGKKRARKKTAGKTTPTIGVTIEKQPYTLPHWAQWIAWTVGVLALAAAIVAIAVTGA
jgi:hypothetical protein